MQVQDHQTLPYQLPTTSLKGKIKASTIKMTLESQREKNAILNIKDEREG